VRFSVVALTAAITACTPGTTADDAGPSMDGGPTSGTIPLSSVRAEAARATCAALYRCCPSTDELSLFFAPVSSGDPEGKYKDLIPKVPPNAPLAEADCPALLDEIYELTSLGPWIAAAEAGYVDYQPARAAECVAQLDDASCGDGARDALFDTTCFSLVFPEGGAIQRSVFVRNATEGDSCTPIADGFGALYFGSCDPDESFCCVKDALGRCGFPSEGKTGTCQRASMVDETCSLFDPVQVCATGLECIPTAGPDGTDGCLAPSEEALAVGEDCYDDSQFRLLGQCSGGYCDLFGSNQCEPQKEDGASCQYAEECSSGACEGGVCGQSTVCTG
ncbi:MAG: hypothetical protein ACO3JL_18305, partial [Myxococcota bacterium]